MKKVFISPAIIVKEVQLTQMLAESLNIYDETVDGADALTKENDWNIWGDEE